MAAITNEIYIGSMEDPTYYFVNDEIYSVTGNLACNIVQDELSIDTLYVTVDYEVINRNVFQPSDYTGILTSESLIFTSYYNDDIRQLPFGTPVWYYSDEKYVGKFYVDSVERETRTKYKIKIVSVIGILAKKNFYGGIYEGYSFSKLIRDIFLSNGLQTKQGIEYTEGYSFSYYSSSYTNHELITGKFNSESIVTMHFTYEGIGYAPTSTGTTQEDGYFGYKYVPFDYTLGDYKYTSTGGNYYVVSQERRASTDAEWETTVYFYLYYGSQTVGPIVVPANTDCILTINGKTGVFSINDEVIRFTPEDFSYKTIITNTTSGESTTIDSSILIGELCYMYWNYTSSGTGSASNDTTILKTKFYGTVIKSDDDILSNIVPYRTLDGTIPNLCNTVSNSSLLYNSRTYMSKTCGPDVMLDYPSFVNYSDTETDMYQSVDYDEGIADYKVYGWLPVLTKREALYQVMFAYNINLVKSNDDTLLFTWLYGANPTEIPDSRVYNSGSITYDEPAKSVELTEHSYTYDSTEDKELLYDNTDGTDSGDITIVFNNAPIYVSSLTATDSLKIIASTVNIAVVNGIGTLKGIPYNHTTNVITKNNSDVDDGETISITDAYLVTLDNSENVMARLYSYYTERQTINNSIVLSGESTGRNYSFTNPFLEKSSAWLKSMDITASSMLKADCEFITNYTPTGNGSNYTNVVVLTGSGTWTVPESVYKKDIKDIKVILIGGGHGGSSGCKGENGRTRGTYSSAPSGGTKGINGDGGKIYTITIENPHLVYDYSCGTGGTGGSICYSEDTPNEGTEGTATTFGDYTSDEGAVIAGGVHNFFTGNVYGRKFSGGVYDYISVDGGDGGYVDYNVYINWPRSISWPLYKNGKATVYSYTYGAGQTSKSAYLSGYNSSYWWNGTFYGGNGGGAAMGSNGGDATAPYLYGTNVVVEGNGGNGGDATLKCTNAIDYDVDGWGNGGFGGYGGGAGGDSGYDNICTAYGIEYWSGSGGTGGYGGEGGDGAPGCIIIYY